MKTLKFGTDGWRAVLAEEFTFEHVRIVVQAIAHYVEQSQQNAQGILIGYDTRFLSRKFALEAAGIVAANGIKAYVVPSATPTPVVAFGVKHLKTAGAIMFTASHNPPEYNGIKFIPDYAGPATPHITKQLEENIAAIFAGHKVVKQIPPKQVKKETFFEEANIRSEYEKHLKSLIDFSVLTQYPMRVVVDSMHGAGSGYVSNLLQEAGWSVTSLRLEEDPYFGGSLPEPNEQHLTALVDTMKDHDAKLGLANDGDADRFGVVDENGRYITPNEVIALLSLHLIKNRKVNGKIVRTVATTGLIDRIAQRYGIDVIETPVGFKYIGQQMLKESVIIGGEESGGLSILGHIPEKDGILADLLVAEMCAIEQKTLTQLLSEMEKEFGGCYAKRLDIHFDKKEVLMDHLRSTPPLTVGDFKVRETNSIDGVKLIMEDQSWVLVRPSGTEPLLRVYCESQSSTQFNRLVNQTEKWLEKLSVDL